MWMLQKSHTKQHVITFGALFHLPTYQVKQQPRFLNHVTINHHQPSSTIINHRQPCLFSKVQRLVIVDPLDPSWGPQLDPDWHDCPEGLVACTVWGLTTWWFQPLRKIWVKMGIFPQFSGWKFQKIFELPPPRRWSVRWSYSFCSWDTPSILRCTFWFALPFEKQCVSMATRGTRYCTKQQAGERHALDALGNMFKLEGSKMAIDSIVWLAFQVYCAMNEPWGSHTWTNHLKHQLQSRKLT